MAGIIRFMVLGPGRHGGMYNVSETMETNYRWKRRQVAPPWVSRNLWGKGFGTADRGEDEWRRKKAESKEKRHVILLLGFFLSLIVIVEGEEINESIPMLVSVRSTLD